jgi:(2S)-methylsuccinyl-CoA dehydrogenase
MSLAASATSTDNELITTLSQAVDAVDALFADARRAVAERVVRDGRANPRLLDREQRATHGLAWLATYVEAIRQLAAYTQRLTATQNFGEIEELLVRIGAGEYLAQIVGGIPMSQGEIVRLGDGRRAHQSGRRASDRLRQHRAASRPAR